MLTVADRLPEIETLPRGDLAEVPYPLLLAAISRSGRTVVLELDRKPIEKRIVFAGGVPVDCRSNLAHETFGRYLVDAGALSEEAFHGALSDSLTREVPIGEVLLERELLDAVALYRHLQQNLARKLLDGFTWRRGTFTVDPRVPEVDATLKVKVPQLILTGILKLVPMQEVMTAIRPLLTEPLVADAAGPDASLRLRGAAARVVAALVEPRRMDELAASTGLAPDDLGRIVYALSLLEVVVPASRAAKQRRATMSRDRAPDHSTVKVSASSAAMAAQELETTRRAVLAAFLSFRRKDSFELLQLEEPATLPEIEAAYLRHARQFAPWPLAEHGLSDLEEKARELFLAGAEAWAELRDGERRLQLIERRRVLRDERAKKPAAHKPIRTDLLDPKLQYERGLELFEAGHHARALEFFQFAADCDSQNALYRAEAANCRLLLSPTSARTEVREELGECVRIDATCGLAHYYLGELLGEDGQLPAAERHLRTAIKLLAPDRRPIDALRSLKAK